MRVAAGRTTALVVGVILIVVAAVAIAVAASKPQIGNFHSTKQNSK